MQLWIFCSIALALTEGFYKHAGSITGKHTAEIKVNDNPSADSSHLKSVLHNWDFSTIIIIRTGVSNWNYFKFFICQLSRWMQNKMDCLTRLCWLSRDSIDWVNEKMEWWEKSSACVFQLLAWIPKRGGLWSTRSSSVMPLQRGDTSVMNTICFS